jgi:uncharacterized repeat protein (TIGR01451 family)
VSVASGRSIHPVSAAVGVLAVLAGVAVLAQPSLATAVPVAAIVTPLIAIFALVIALWLVRERYNTTLDHVAFPTAELPFAMSTPGDDIDEMLYRYTQLGEATLEYPEQIGERLRDVAVAVIARREECTRDEALDRLEDGSWTDNRWAAAFFSERVAPPTLSRLDRVRRRFGSGEGAYERQVRETVDAIVDVAELVDDSTTERNPDDGQTGIRTRLTGDGEDSLADAVAGDRPGVHAFRDDEGELVTDGVRDRGTRTTGRWTGIGAFALISTAAGIVTVEPGLLLGAAVAVVYAAYGRTGGSPDLVNLSIERELSNETPAPGDEVEVTVTVENDGDAFVPDLRLVDLIPPNMRVVSGSPRLYTALRSGAHARYRYTVVAERGEHEWPMLAVGSGFAGSSEQEVVHDVETTIRCLPRLSTVSTVPVRSQTTVYSGQVETREGGSGLEFHSVREYRSNDPMNRVDWNRRARTGELATVNFRQERAAKVVLLFDARQGAYVADRPGGRHALDRSVDAASEIYTALSDGGNLVGVAAFDTVECWLAPSAGENHDERVRRLLANHTALASLPPDMLDVDVPYTDPMTHVRRQLQPGTQVMLFSPLTSNYPGEVARRLDSAGHRVTVVSPDPTNDRTPGQRLARVERAMRVNRIRESGVRVIDWGAEESLGLTFSRATRRSSA